MKGSETKLVQFLQGSDKRFIIPVYQRNYDWKIENCKEKFQTEWSKRLCDVIVPMLREV